MPILKQEPDIFPEHLLESAGPAEGQCLWYMFYTRSRCEKTLARHLFAAHVPFYAPVVSRRTCAAGVRVRTSFVPLFPNYVFMFGTAEDRYQALTTSLISRSLEVRDAEQLRADLRQVRRLILMEAPLTVEARIQPGQHVRVRSGPFAGFEGVVQRRHKATLLVVYVHFLQQGVSVELADCQVEPV